MIRRWVCVVMVALLLAACGTTSGGNTAGGGESGTRAAPPGPEATVSQALDALAARDEATLTGMYDESVGNLKSVRAAEGVSTWLRIQSPAKVPGALGAVQSRQMQPAELRGQTTVIPVIVTHARGISRWEFSLIQTEQGWRLINIHGQVQEQQMP